MIDERLAEFLQQGLSIHMGTRDGRLQPDGARVVAVTVEPDGRHVTAHVADVAAARLLPNLEANGQAALTFARPVDERACQVKGVFAGARATTPDERATLDAQWEGFLQQLEAIGIPRAAAMGWTTWPATAIRLKVTTIFDQSPATQAAALQA
jgi:hypothetical protein